VCVNKETMKFLNPINIFNTLWVYRELIWQFTLREVQNRYKGSYLGIIWSIINPLFMLIVYTFVFGVVFKARWGLQTSDNKAEFALTLFCGLIVFNIFSECITRAPGLVISNPNYVKKVIFPLEILPVSVLGSALIHTLISLILLEIGTMLCLHKINLTIFMFPIIIMPVIFFSLGLSWLFSSLGVFIRDLMHGVSFLTQVLFFMTPIFYPISAVPERYQLVMKINPLTVIVEDSRSVLMWGQEPNWISWGIVTIASLIVMQLGYLWFMKSKRAFADVM